MDRRAELDLSIRILEYYAERGPEQIADEPLVVGNTILLKHAPSVPQCALALEELFADAGAPQGVFTNLFVDVLDIARIVEDPLVRACSLTGSDRAGSAFGENAGRNVKKAG